MLKASSGEEGSRESEEIVTKGLKRGPIYTDRRTSSLRVNPTPVNPV